MLYSKKMKLKTNKTDSSSQETLAYPACFHFRILADTEAHVESELLQVVNTFQVIEQLVPARASTAGRYTAYGVSIMMQSRAEMVAFDAAVKQVRGVRMVL